MGQGAIMKKQLLCGVATGALAFVASGASFAADMPVKAGPIGCMWDGTYIGGHVGYGGADFRGTWFGDSITQPFRQHPSGFVGGVQVGQDWCANNTFVYGWEGDASFMNWRKSGQFSFSDDHFGNRVSLLSSLRLKLGTTINDPKTLLLYVTAGPALAHWKATITDTSVPNSASSTFNSFGGVVGLGADYAVTKNWIWGIEGLYYFFDASKILSAGGDDAAGDRLRSAFEVRLSLSYKFDTWGKGPVVAKY
jgi:high affinity Mn2+ porin